MIDVPTSAQASFHLSIDHSFEISNKRFLIHLFLYCLYISFLKFLGWIWHISNQDGQKLPKINKSQDLVLKCSAWNFLFDPCLSLFLGSMLPQYMALCVS